MSSEARPITLVAFAEAIKDLELPSLHAKAAELRNSIYHLTLSNSQLVPFAEEGDRDCAEAIKENEEVIQSMRERVSLLKAEVEGRGMPWVEEPKLEEKEQVNGDVGEVQTNGSAENAAAEHDTAEQSTGGTAATSAQQTATGTVQPDRRAEDEQLLQRLLQRAQETATQGGAEEEEGVYL